MATTITPETPVGTRSLLDVEKIRRDFPALHQKVYGKPLVYLDNAATSQKPQVVIDTVSRYYTIENSNIHRGVHYLSERATRAYENARVKVKEFINAREAREIIFCRSTTEGINLVAQSFGRELVKPGDEILITAMEHHSNIVPWQILCGQTGAVLKAAPINNAGELPLGGFEKLLSSRTKLVSVAHISNALGTINPVEQIIEMARRRKIPVVVDGAQAAPHLKVNVQKLNADFYIFSGHKMFGPTGIGVVYGKAHLLEAMPPYQGGGDMILSVTFEKTTYNVIPHKFEAGTPNIAGAIGLGSTIEYLSGIGMDNITGYEEELLEYGTGKLSAVSGLRLIGTAKKKAGILSFVMDGIHPHDIGTILDREGIAVRTGHHCAQPVMQRFGVPATVRASLAFYNTKEEIDALVAGLSETRKVFG